MSDRQIVLLFIKAPMQGRVKSRLAGAIGEEAALDLYRSFILDTIDMLERTGCAFRIWFRCGTGACWSRPSRSCGVRRW